MTKTQTPFTWIKQLLIFYYIYFLSHMDKCVYTHLLTNIQTFMYTYIHTHSFFAKSFRVVDITVFHP